MTNKVRGDIELTTVEGVKVPLRMTWDALANLQDDLETDNIDGVMTALISAINGKGSVRVVVNFIHRLANAGDKSGAGYSYEDVAAMDLKDPLEVPARLLEAAYASGFLQTADNDDEKAADDQPGKPQAKPRTKLPKRKAG